MKIAALGLLLSLFVSESPSGYEPPSAPDEQDSQAIEHTTFRPVAPKPASGGFQKQSSPQPLKVAIFPFYNKLPSNSQCLIAIELQIARGWHINANPANPDWMKPTVVKLKTKHDIKLSKIKYPKHHELMAAGATEPYHVYDGKPIVYALLETKDLSKVQEAEMEFLVEFQGCNSDQCLPPDSIVMKGKLKVAAKDEQLEKINAEKFPKPKKKKATTDK